MASHADVPRCKDASCMISRLSLECARAQALLHEFCCTVHTRHRLALMLTTEHDVHGAAMQGVMLDIVSMLFTLLRAYVPAEFRWSLLMDFYDMFAWNICMCTIALLRLLRACVSPSLSFPRLTQFRCDPSCTKRACLAPQLLLCMACAAMCSMHREAPNPRSVTVRLPTHHPKQLTRAREWPLV